MEKKYKENKLAQFLKKNVYAILMVFCLLAIVGLVIYTVMANKAASDDVVPAAVVDVDGNPVDKTGEEDKSSADLLPNAEEKGDKEENVTPTAQEFVIITPVATASVLQDYTDATLVYNATMKHWATHQGVDYQAEVGTPVRAVFDGEVSEIVTTTMRGTQVTLQHSGGFGTTYALLGSNVNVKVGDKVSKGDVLGYVAETGYFESADPAHLHFELRKNGELVDPNYYFDNSSNK